MFTGRVWNGLFTSRIWKREHAPGLLILAFAGSCLLLRELGAVGSFKMVLLGVIWAMPGWLWAPRLLGHSQTHGRIVWGAVLGLLFTSGSAAVIACVLAQPLWLAAIISSGLASGGGCVQALIAGRKAKARARKESDIQLTNLVCGVSLLAMLAMSLPYEAVGRRTDRGLAYRHWFQNDFFNHMAIASELSHGEIPPTNPYFSGSPLRYYWLFHVFPSAVAAWMGPAFPVENILLAYGYGLASLFGAGLALSLGVEKTRRAGLLACCIGLFAYNYQGTVVALQSVTLGLMGIPPLMTLPFRDIGILTHCAFGRGFEPGIESFYKQLLYSQQHVVALLGLLLIFQSRRNRASGWTAGAWDGALAGLAAGFSSFMGLLAIAWLVACSALQSLRSRNRAQAAYLASCILSAAGVLLIWQALGMGSRGFPLVYAPAKGALMALPFYLFLSLGPAGVLCLVARHSAWRRVHWEMWLLGALTLLLILLVDYGPLPGSLSNKVGFALRIPFLAAISVYLSHDRRHRLSNGVIAMIVLLGTPVFVITLLLHSVVRFPGGVSYVDESDAKACAWIKEHVPDRDVVQPFPDYDGEPNSYALAAVFAGRRQALGDIHHASLFGPSMEDVMERSRWVAQMFTAQSAEAAWRLARDGHIDWIVVGPMERARLGLKTVVFDEDRSLFHSVYSQDGVRIYEVEKDVGG